MKRKNQSGQVMLLGITIMVILLLIILYAFDIHNVIRAKLKVEIASQAASLTGANWQMETLNLIGDINLLKASALLLEGSNNWKTPLPDKEQEPEEWNREMQARVDLLTEMQTRASFIGPLIGFSAAQQAAKNNGMTRVNNALATYLELLNYDNRYIEGNGGAPKYINNYDWREPYINMIDRINRAGVAVFPNARVAGMPHTYPAALGNPRFYTEILKNAEAIAAHDPPDLHFWHLANGMLRTMDDAAFKGKWWDINYDENKFPNESEIFTVGVEFGGEYDENDILNMNNLKPDMQFYPGAGELPASMKWCIYDQWWYPEYYHGKYEDYDRDHYSYWFRGSVLRKEVKPQYIYEGPAAYTEGFADVQSVITVRPSVRQGGFMKHTDAGKAIRKRDGGILVKKSVTSTRVGTQRGSSEDSDITTAYRPGTMAKVLGELRNETPPIAIDIILPVFKGSSPMPTYMPVPYGFQVLKMGYSDFERFLNWLAEQNDLEGVPPVGTEKYLQALRLLVNGVKDRSAGSGKKTAAVPGGYISGRGFRYYGYNHRFNKSNFEKEFKDRLYDWYNVRADRVFQQTVLTGPGWLQEPQLFANEPFLTPYSYTKELVGNEQPRFKESQIITDKYGRRIEIYEGVVVRRGNNIYHVSKTTHKVAMPDSINGGTAYRVYVNTEPGRRHYYVIDSRNKIVLNSEMDPTILYNNDFSSGSGGNHIIWNPGGYDAQKGPLRL